MNAQTKAKNHIRNWLKANDMTAERLSRKVGMTRHYVRVFLKRESISYRPFVVLSEVIDFPETLLADCKKEYDKHYWKVNQCHRGRRSKQIDRNAALRNW